MFSAENTNNCSKSGRLSSTFCSRCKQSVPWLGLEGLHDLAGKLQSFEGHQEIHRRACNLDVNVGPPAICRGGGRATPPSPRWWNFQEKEAASPQKKLGITSEEQEEAADYTGRGSLIWRPQHCSSLQPHGELISTCAIDRRRETQREWRGGSDCAGYCKAWTNTSAVPHRDLQSCLCFSLDHFQTYRTVFGCFSLGFLTHSADGDTLHTSWFLRHFFYFQALVWSCSCSCFPHYHSLLRWQPPLVLIWFDQLQPTAQL